jgi:hypothetical protein
MPLTPPEGTCSWERVQVTRVMKARVHYLLNCPPTSSSFMTEEPRPAERLLGYVRLKAETPRWPRLGAARARGKVHLLQANAV